MINNGAAFLIAATGYLGIFFSAVFLLTGVDFWFTAQFALFSLGAIWLGKWLDRAVTASKPMPK